MEMGEMDRALSTKIIIIIKIIITALGSFN